MESSIVAMARMNPTVNNSTATFLMLSNATNQAKTFAPGKLGFVMVEMIVQITKTKMTLYVVIQVIRILAKLGFTATINAFCRIKFVMARITAQMELMRKTAVVALKNFPAMLMLGHSASVE